MCGKQQENDRNTEEGVANSTLSLPLMPTLTGELLGTPFSPTPSSLLKYSPPPAANFQIGTMINDPGKNLISCPVVQGWFPIKELTQDNYFLSTASNLLFNCGHSSLSVWKQNQFLNFHLVTIPKDHRMLELEGTLKAM